MLITLSVIIGVETIVLVVLVIKFTVQRGIISQHDVQVQQQTENHARELQALAEGRDKLLEQQKESALEARRQQEEATKLALSKQQSAFEEAKQLLASRYETQLQEKDGIIASNAANAEKLLKETKDGYEERLQQQKDEFSKASAALEERWKKELEALRVEFKNSAGEMLDARTQKLDASNQEKMKELFDPFKEKIKELQEQLTNSQTDRATLRSEVQAQLNAVKQNADKMVSEADKLTNALKGTNKVQGNWGELQLELALEACGLMKGVHFMMQSSIVDANGKPYTDGEQGYLIPDATIFLPERRRVFIDSKVSMTAYLDYVNASDDNAKALALEELVKSIKAHIRSLSSKNYPGAGNRAVPNSSFEYTIMFMGNEGALMLALNKEPDLWDKAFRNDKIILVSRMALYPLLWLILKSWQVEKQSKKQEAILSDMKSLIKKLENFVGNFTKIGKKIDDLEKTYEGIINSWRLENRKGLLNTAKRIADNIGVDDANINGIVFEVENEEIDDADETDTQEQEHQTVLVSPELPGGEDVNNSDENGVSP